MDEVAAAVLAEVPVEVVVEENERRASIALDTVFGVSGAIQEEPEEEEAAEVVREKVIEPAAASADEDDIMAAVFATIDTAAVEVQVHREAEAPVTPRASLTEEKENVGG